MSATVAVILTLASIVVGVIESVSETPDYGVLYICLLAAIVFALLDVSDSVRKHGGKP